MASRVRATAFGETAEAEAALSINFAISFLTGEGKIDDFVSFAWPPTVLTALQASKFTGSCESEEFVQMVLVLRSCNVWMEDVEALCEEFDSIDQVRAFLSVGPSQVSFLAESVIRPGIDSNGDKQAGLHPSDFPRKMQRIASLQSVKDFLLSVSSQPNPQTALAASAGGVGDQSGMSSALTALGEGLKSLVRASDDFECPVDRYSKLLSDHCDAKRGGVPFVKDVIPTRALVGKLIKQKDAGTFDAIPVKLCSPAYLFETKELLAQGGKKKIQLGAALGAEVPFSLSDFERVAPLGDFLQQLKVLGTAYNVLEIVDQVTWDTHMEQVTERLRQFPDHGAKIRLAEFTLRQLWASYAREKHVPFLTAIKHNQEVQASQMFWLNSCYMVENTRITSPPAPREFGKGSGVGGGQKRLSPSGPQVRPGKKSNTSKTFAPSRPASTPSPKKKAERSGSLRQYKGPLKFEHQGGRICFAGCTKKGCQKTNCSLADSHGVCPFPGCLAKGVKHLCEEAHPALWAEFAKVRPAFA